MFNEFQKIIDTVNKEKNKLLRIISTHEIK